MTCSAWPVPTALVTVQMKVVLTCRSTECTSSWRPWTTAEDGKTPEVLGVWGSGEGHSRVQREEQACPDGQGSGAKHRHWPYPWRRQMPALLPQTLVSRPRPSFFGPRGSDPSPPPSDPEVQAPASSLRLRGQDPSLLPQTHIGVM